jgi:fermentation-respiration switch protein FrsA (DUF1100 family)
VRTLLLILLTGVAVYVLLSAYVYVFQARRLLCHGNAGNIAHRLNWLETFSGMGSAMLLFDYRGFGRSSGTPTERGTLVVHSRDDEMIPFPHGEELHRRASGPAQLLEIVGDHNAAFMLSGPKLIQGMRSFLEAHGILKASVALAR